MLQDSVSNFAVNSITNLYFVAFKMERKDRFTTVPLHPLSDQSDGIIVLISSDPPVKLDIYVYSLENCVFSIQR